LEGEIDMSQDTYNIGDMVILSVADRRDISAVVSSPIEPGRAGHVLLIKDGCLIGTNASVDDVTLVDESTQGFAQLAYKLIMLGSHVIEKTLL
jgi:hypothetical protein